MSARLVTLLTLAVAACGDDPATTADTADTSQPADTAQDSTPADTTADVAPDTDLVEGPVTERFRILDMGGKLDRLPEVSVRFYLPGGRMVQRPTDVRGEVEIEVDYTQGTLGAALVGLPERPGGAFLGFRQHDWDRLRDDQGTIVVGAPAAMPAKSGVDLYGQAINVDPAANALFVATDLAPVAYDARSFEWRVEDVALGRGGALIASIRNTPLGTGRAVNQDVLGWVEGKVDPVQVDTELTLDFQSSLVPTTTSGTFQAPAGGPESFQDRYRMWVVTSGLTAAGPNAYLTVSTPTELDVDQSGLVSYTVEHVQPSMVSGFFTRFLVIDREIYSYADVEGPPPAGTQDVELYPIPTMGTHDAMPLADTIYWDTPPEDALLYLAYDDGPTDDRERALLVVLPPGTMSFDLDDHPELAPSLAGRSSLSVALSFCDMQRTRWSAPLAWCTRLASGGHVPLIP